MIPLASLTASKIAFECPKQLNIPWNSLDLPYNKLHRYPMAHVKTRVTLMSQSSPTIEMRKQKMRFCQFWSAFNWSEYANHATERISIEFHCPQTMNPSNGNAAYRNWSRKVQFYCHTIRDLTKSQSVHNESGQSSGNVRRIYRQWTVAYLCNCIVGIWSLSLAYHLQPSCALFQSCDRQSRKWRASETFFSAILFTNSKIVERFSAFFEYSVKVNKIESSSKQWDKAYCIDKCNLRDIQYDFRLAKVNHRVPLVL